MEVRRLFALSVLMSFLAFGMVTRLYPSRSFDQY
jgi:hypothetical protein